MDKIAKLLYFADPPQPMAEQTIYGVQFDKPAFVTVTIQSNPAPKTQWLVDHKQILEGGYLDRFQARTPVQLVSTNKEGMNLFICGTLSDRKKRNTRRKNSKSIRSFLEIENFEFG